MEKMEIEDFVNNYVRGIVKVCAEATRGDYKFGTLWQRAEGELITRICFMIAFIREQKIEVIEKIATEYKEI